ncbi:MAG: RDD family protein [Planctomycetes bacterium]|nr:RDD family protein [Planctomycetota bacterium]
MPCMNHPEVLAGLDSCTRCAKSFCIDCLVGRKSGWFCAACDKELSAPPAASPPPPPPAPAPAPVALKVVPAAAACANHPDVLGGLNPCSNCEKSFCPDCLVELKGRRFCAACKLEAVRDIQSGVDSSSGLQLAGIGARFLAQFIDGFAINLILIPLMVVMGIVIAAVRPGPDSMVMPLIVFGFYGLLFAAIFCYHGFMLQWKGQTLGKMAMKIKVVTPEGGPISAGQAWIRVLVWFLLHGCLIDYIPALFNKEKMAIHDMAARTRVVKIG